MTPSTVATTAAQMEMFSVFMRTSPMSKSSKRTLYHRSENPPKMVVLRAELKEKTTITRRGAYRTA